MSYVEWDLAWNHGDAPPYSAELELLDFTYVANAAAIPPRPSLPSQRGLSVAGSKDGGLLTTSWKARSIIQHNRQDHVF